MKTLVTVLTLAVLTLAACEKPAEKTSTYDPKYDGVTPNALNKPVDKSILDPQNRVAAAESSTETPARTTASAPATATAPAATAPAEAASEPAPAAN